MKPHASASLVNDKLMDFARYRKSRAKRLFERFFVVGLQSEDLDKAGDAGDGKVSLIPGRVLYKYPEKADSKQVEVRSYCIQDFVFPNGPKCTQVNNLKSPEQQELLKNLLYQIPNNRINSFVFTMD